MDETKTNKIEKKSAPITDINQSLGPLPDDFVRNSDIIKGLLTTHYGLRYVRQKKVPVATCTSSSSSNAPK